jgi:hypothetical protein
VESLDGVAAEKTLLENRNQTAHVNLADISTDGSEVVDRGWDGGRSRAVQIGNTKNINVAA